LKNTARASVILISVDIYHDQMDTNM